MPETYVVEVTRVDGVSKYLTIIKIDKHTYTVQCDNKTATIHVNLDDPSINNIMSEFIEQLDWLCLSLPVLKLVVNIFVRLWCQAIVPPLIRCKQNYGPKKKKSSLKSWSVCTTGEDIELEKDRDRVVWVIEQDNTIHELDNEFGGPEYDYNSLFRRLILGS